MFNVNKKQKIIFSLAMIGVFLFTAVAPFPFNNFDRNIVNAQDTSAHGTGIAPGTSANSSAHIEKVDADNDKCGLRNISKCGEKVAEFLAGWVAGLLLMIAGWVLGLSGLLLNTTISYTIVEMSEMVRGMVSINTAWSTFRDLANIFFIFIILYIAIMTILRMDTATTKKLLVHVVIMALLLNFSLFFTKVVIDTSNITATFFYEQIKDAGGDMGLSGAFMQKLGMQSFLDPAGAAKLLGERKGFINILLLGFLASLLFMIVAFVFVAAAILIVIRFVVFIFLMILSPLAFAAMALPNDKWSKKWWDALISQAIFAPAFLALIWVTLVILGDVVGNSQASFVDLIPTEGQKGVFEPGKEGSIQLVLNFIIIIGMTIFSIIAAKILGVQGGEKAVKWATNASKRMSSAPARQTVGRLSAGADSWLGKTRLGNTLVGSALRAPLGAVGKSKFGSKGPSGANLNAKTKKRKGAYDSAKAEAERKSNERKAREQTTEKRIEELNTKLQSDEQTINAGRDIEQARAQKLGTSSADVVASINAKYDKAIQEARKKKEEQEREIKREGKIDPEILKEIQELSASKIEEGPSIKIRIPFTDKKTQVKTGTLLVSLSKKRRKEIAEKVRKAKVGEKIEGPKDSLEDTLKKLIKDEEKKDKDAGGDKKPQ